MSDEAAPTALAFTNNDCSYGARGCMTLPSAPNNQMVGETPDSVSETSGRYLVENSRLHNPSIQPLTTQLMSSKRLILRKK